MLIEKICKNCNLKFSFEYEPAGKGSGNQLCRKYCGPSCKEEVKFSRRYNSLSTRLEKKCEICNSIFFVPKSLSNRKLCSKACRHAHHSKVLKQHQVIEKFCVQCCTSFFASEVSKKKFCSPNCFSRSQQSKNHLICEVCHKDFFVKKSYQARFCSKKCASIAQSNGLVKIHVSGRSGTRTDIENSPYFKSSFEADYYRYCLQCLNIRPLYEYQTFTLQVNGNLRYYTPDFYFPNEDEFVELKGVKYAKENKFAELLNSNFECYEQLRSMNVKIRIIYMNDFYSELKQNGLYLTITNLENRDYANTKHLICKHN